MSEYAREANAEWLGDLWRIYLEEVAAARGTTPEELDVYAQETPRLIAEAAGDTARAALDYGLVDQTLSRVEMRERLIELVGEDEDTHSYNQVALSDYLKSLGDDRFGRGAGGNKIAVVVARGTILDGTQPAGAIGGDSTAALIRRARTDDNV
jgi:protease-4